MPVKNAKKRLGLILCFGTPVLSGCVAPSVVQSPIILPQAGILRTSKIVIDNPTWVQTFRKRALITHTLANSMVNSIALDLARRFPSIKIICPQRYAQIPKKLNLENLFFSPGVVNGNHVELELKVLSWNPGNVGFMAIFTGTGMTPMADTKSKLSVRATVVKVSGTGVRSKPLAESVFTAPVVGNTIYRSVIEVPWKEAAGGIAEWLGNQLKGQKSRPD
jgi:hypothetical protein